MAIRAAAAESEGSGYKLDNTPTYFADVWALHKDIPDQVLREHRCHAVNPDMEATKFCTTKGMLKRERIWAANYFANGVWTSGKTGQATADSTHVVFWDDPSSTPIEDIRAARRVVHLASRADSPRTSLS
jgi:hypothetical protein